jgi:hypothetical protein
MFKNKYFMTGERKKEGHMRTTALCTDDRWGGSIHPYPNRRRMGGMDHIYPSGRMTMGVSQGHRVCFFYYYETIKRKLNKRLMYECRCDERLKPKAGSSSCLAYNVLRSVHDFQNALLKKRKKIVEEEERNER